jgi:hypothetical protein
LGPSFHPKKGHPKIKILKTKLEREREKKKTLHLHGWPTNPLGVVGNPNSRGCTPIAKAVYKAYPVELTSKPETKMLFHSYEITIPLIFWKNSNSSFCGNSYSR